jgi:hypothetical protein
MTEQGSDARLPKEAAQRMADLLAAEERRQREEEHRLAQVRMTESEEG